MIVVVAPDGCRWTLTAHAMQRYADRVPDGPGLAVDVKEVRRATKGVLKKIRASCIAHGTGKASENAYFVTRRDRSLVVVAAVKGKARYTVLTCFKLDR